MRVRRTGAGRGQRATYYIQATREDDPELYAGILDGAIEERAPVGTLYRGVLVWGFARKSGARATLARLQAALDA